MELKVCSLFVLKLEGIREQFLVGWLRSSLIFIPEIKSVSLGDGDASLHVAHCLNSWYVCVICTISLLVVMRIQCLLLGWHGGGVFIFRSTRMIVVRADQWYTKLWFELAPCAYSIAPIYEDHLRRSSGGDHGFCEWLEGNGLHCGSCRSYHGRQPF